MPGASPGCIGFVTLSWLQPGGHSLLAASNKVHGDGMLCCSSSHIVGIGLRGQCPHGLKCWLYFPEDNCPFYRTTDFSHYAPKNCPSPGSRLATVCLVKISSSCLWKAHTPMYSPQGR